jgi:hypothetical protein
MDPITFLVIAAFTAWLAAAPDRNTLTATRGTLGAARSAGRAAAGVVRSEWVAAAPARSAAWTARKDRLRKTRSGRAALTGIWLVGGAGRATRRGWRMTRAVGRAARAGITAVPAGYRDGARRAADRREQRRTRSRRPVFRPFTPTPPATGTTGPGGTGTTGTTGGPRVIDQDGRPVAATGPDPATTQPTGQPTTQAGTDPAGTATSGDPDGPGPAAGVPPMSERTHLFGRPLSDSDRRQLGLRDAGYAGWIDQDGYAVDADHRRLSDAEVADWIATGRRGDWGSPAAPGDWGSPAASAGSATTNPAGDPADGITPPSTEETAMSLSSIGSGLLDQVTAFASNFVGAGEWESTADLRAEVDQAEELAEAATAVIEALRKWADALEESYAAAPFHTRAMAESVATIGESAGDPAVLGEALLGMRAAINEADALGEAGEALEAAGNVEAFAAQ